MPERSNVVALDSARIEGEAAAWVARLDGDGANEADRAAFEAWCNLSEQHLKAAQGLAELWSDMDLLGKRSSKKQPVPQPSPAKGQVPIRS